MAADCNGRTYVAQATEKTKPAARFPGSQTSCRHGQCRGCAAVSGLFVLLDPLEDEHDVGGVLGGEVLRPVARRTARGRHARVVAPRSARGMTWSITKGSWQRTCGAQQYSQKFLARR